MEETILIAMDWLYRLCIWISGISLLIMTTVIPIGIFNRYVLGIGLITPPVGSVLFVGSAVANLSIEKLTRAMLPFYFGLLAVLMGITYIPEISLWLPHLVGLN